MAAVAVTGARLIDGTGSDPVEGASVVVEDGRIAAAGRLGALPREARPRPRRRDGAARLIDAHGAAARRVDNGERMAHHRGGLPARTE